MRHRFKLALRFKMYIYWKDLTLVGPTAETSQLEFSSAEAPREQYKTENPKWCSANPRIRYRNELGMKFPLRDPRRFRQKIQIDEDRIVTFWFRVALRCEGVTLQVLVKYRLTPILISNSNSRPGFFSHRQIRRKKIRNQCGALRCLFRSVNDCIQLFHSYNQVCG